VGSLTWVGDSQGTARFAEGCAKVPLPASLDRLDWSHRARRAVRGGQQRAARLAELGRQGGPGRHGGSRGNVDESRSQRPDEQLLTGDTATKVREAALAKYPGATVLRVETDSDGVYEAHLTTSDGQRVTVEVDKSFKVTGDESGHGRP
jgi:hypothetical protein